MADNTHIQELLQKVMNLDRRCKYASILDSQGSKITEVIKEGIVPYESDTARTEGLRISLRFAVSQARKQSGPLRAIITLYEKDYTLATQLKEGILYVSFDYELSSELIDKILNLVK
jgi:DNA-binding MarR family transcriptional regulator